jgi:putative flippase GtrA
MMQILRFLAVGVFNSIFGYGVIFACMYLAGMSPEISNVVGYAVGLAGSYVLNRNYTFRSTKRQRTEIVRFFACFSVAYILNFSVLLVSVHGLHMAKGLSQILSGLVYVVSSFLMSKYYVFKTRHAS